MSDKNFLLDLILLTGLNWLWLSVVILIIDLISKFILINNFYLGESMFLFPLLNIYYVRNYGAAFSTFANSDRHWQLWFFLIITTCICIMLLLQMYHSDKSDKINNVACALIIGGALGNLFDRLWHGFVVDMIDFHIGNWHFATFNCADVAICFGVALVILNNCCFKLIKKS